MAQNLPKSVLLHEIIPSLTGLINDSAETTTTTYSSDKVASLISGLSGGGAILLATTYDRTATTGLLFCSQYNVND